MVAAVVARVACLGDAAGSASVEVGGAWCVASARFVAAARGGVDLTVDVEWASAGDDIDGGDGAARAAAEVREVVVSAVRPSVVVARFPKAGVALKVVFCRPTGGGSEEPAPRPGAELCAAVVAAALALADAGIELEGLVAACAAEVSSSPPSASSSSSSSRGGAAPLEVRQLLDDAEVASGASVAKKESRRTTVVVVATRGPSEHLTLCRQTGALALRRDDLRRATAAAAAGCCTVHDAMVAALQQKASSS